MSGSLVIEDDDGFRTEWPFPDGTSILHGSNPDWVSIFEAQHDVLRQRREVAR